MNDKKIIIGIILTTVLILGGGVFLLDKTNSSNVVSSQNAKVKVSEKTYDWGKILYDKGNVSKTFTIKNTGTEVLKLNNIKTSCACTKAQVTIGKEKSPYFDMHSYSAWIGEVAPGKDAKLEVIFDPQFHGPSAVGPMTRLISVATNDSNNKTLEFTLTGNVVK